MSKVMTIQLQKVNKKRGIKKKGFYKRKAEREGWGQMDSRHWEE